VEGFGFWDGAAAADSEVEGLFWGFSSRGRAVPSLGVLRELSESSLIRDFGRDGSVGVARAARFEEREFEGAGLLSGCDSSLSGCEASTGGASILTSGAEEVNSLGAAGGACDWRATGRAGLRMARRRFSIGAYPAVSPRMKLIATNAKPIMAN